MDPSISRNVPRFLFIAAVHSAGIYFSPKSTDYFAEPYMKAFKDVMRAVLEAHREFQIGTPRTLSTFHGEELAALRERRLSTAEAESGIVEFDQALSFSTTSKGSSRRATRFRSRQTPARRSGKRLIAKIPSFTRVAVVWAE